MPPFQIVRDDIGKRIGAGVSLELRIKPGFDAYTIANATVENRSFEQYNWLAWLSRER